MIAGHFDSVSGPGVFYRLQALRPGDDIAVTVTGGSIVHFTVTSTRQVPKSRFPTRLVYRQTTRPSLRLITCEGAFDQSTGHYVDNLIVFARLRERPAPYPPAIGCCPTSAKRRRARCSSRIGRGTRGLRSHPR